MQRRPGAIHVASVAVSIAAIVACSKGDSDGGGHNGLGGQPTTSTTSASSNDGSTAEPDTGSGPAASSSTGEDPGSTGQPDTSCDPGLSPCGQTCVDLQTDPSNCGGCGVTCVIPNGTAVCQGGACAFESCARGWGDCDGMLANGCEAMAQCNPGDSCQTACGSTGVVACDDGCTPTCTVPAETCNAIDDDCNDACDEGPIPGCRAAVHRASSPTLGHFYTLDLGEANAGDYSLEAQDYFFVLADAVPELSPLHRCLRPNGKRFYTLSANCEGAGDLEGVLGHIAPDDRCGSTALYRLYHSGNNAHFYTVSAAERDNAVNNLGWTFESIVGYVWLGA